MNFGYQEQRTGGGTIPQNGVIAFNKQIANYDTTVSYNDSAFTISSSGDYYVSWNVALKTGLGISGPTISLVTSTTPQQIFSSSNSMKTGQISGSAVLRVTTVPTTFQLVNTTGSSIVLADNVAVSANLTIIAINGETAGANYYLINKSGANLAGGAIVPFNELVTEFNDLISNETGVIKISNSGKYIVDWSISLNGSADADSLKFNLVNVSGADTTVIGSSESPALFPCTIYGNTLINIINATEEEPYEIELINASASTTITTESTESMPAALTLASQTIQASIRIVQI